MAPRTSKVPGRPPSCGLDERARAPDPSHAAPALGPMDDYLDHLAQLARMASLLERLPDAADAIRRWRCVGEAERGPEPAPKPNDAILQAYGELDPLIRRAFDAVVAGLDKLAQSAVELCARTPDPPRDSEIEACAEIGAAMRQLLERALAIAESARPRNSAALPTRCRELRMRRRTDRAQGLQ
jgi:hypothetical protein